MSYTPGPWRIKNGRVVSEPRHGEGYAHGGEYVAISIGNEDDARLIAAAPMLLNALRWSVNQEGECLGDHPALLHEAKSLLAEIEGRA